MYIQVQKFNKRPGRLIEQIRYIESELVIGWIDYPAGGRRPIMAYTGSFRLKGVSLSDLRYMKGWGFYLLKDMKV